MALWILRTAFLLVAGGIGYSLTLAPELQQGKWWVFPVVMLFAIVIIAGDVLIPRKRIELISSIYIGIVVGIFLTFLVRTVISPLFDNSQTNLAGLIILPVGVGICYICISLLVQTKDDFRFIIPYVEFSRDLKGLRPIVLDTSAIIDGRLAELTETNIIENQLVMPGFVLAELQGIADSNDRLRRARGRRGPASICSTARRPG